MIKRIIILFVVLMLTLTCVGCTTQKSIDASHGIQVLSLEELEKIEVVIEWHDALKAYSTFDDLVRMSNGLIKFTVEKRYFIEFELDFLGNDKTPMKQSGTIYEVTVNNSLFGLGLKTNDTIKIFANHSPGDFMPKSIGLVEGNTYLAFIHYLPDGAPESLESIVEYSFFDDEFGVIICKENNEFLVKDTIGKVFGFPLNRISSDQVNIYDKGVLSYFSTELTPYNFDGWSSLISDDFEDSLQEKCNSILKGE